MITTGPNTGAMMVTDASGAYSVTRLQPSTLTVNVSAANYTPMAKTINLTGNQTLSFALDPRAVAPAPAPACSYALSVGNTIDGYPNGGTFTVAVTTNGACAWSVSTDAPSWIHLQGAVSGAGNGVFVFSTDSNSAGSTRTGTVRCADKTITVNQTAIGPPAPQPAAGNTFLSYSSQSGDYIGQGQSERFTLAQAVFRATADTARNHIQISVTSPTRPPAFWWYLYLGAPTGQVLSPGAYEGAQRFGFQLPSLPGLDFSGDGRGCNTLTGRFVILDISYGVTNGIDVPINHMHATFEQHCEEASPAVTGEVLILADPWR